MEGPQGSSGIPHNPQSLGLPKKTTTDKGNTQSGISRTTSEIFLNTPKTDTTYEPQRARSLSLPLQNTPKGEEEGVDNLGVHTLIKPNETSTTSALEKDIQNDIALAQGAFFAGKAMKTPEEREKVNNAKILCARALNKLDEGIKKGGPNQAPLQDLKLYLQGLIKRKELPLMSEDEITSLTDKKTTTEKKAESQEKKKQAIEIRKQDRTPQENTPGANYFTTYAKGKQSENLGKQIVAGAFTTRPETSTKKALDLPSEKVEGWKSRFTGTGRGRIFVSLKEGDKALKACMDTINEAKSDMDKGNYTQAKEKIEQAKEKLENVTLPSTCDKEFIIKHLEDMNLFASKLENLPTDLNDIIKIENLLTLIEGEKYIEQLIIQMHQEDPKSFMQTWAENYNKKISDLKSNQLSSLTYKNYNLLTKDNQNTWIKLVNKQNGGIKNITTLFKDFAKSGGIEAFKNLDTMRTIIGDDALPDILQEMVSSLTNQQKDKLISELTNNKSELRPEGSSSSLGKMIAAAMIKANEKDYTSPQVTSTKLYELFDLADRAGDEASFKLVLDYVKHIDNIPSSYSIEFSRDVTVRHHTDFKEKQPNIQKKSVKVESPILNELSAAKQIAKIRFGTQEQKTEGLTQLLTLLTSKKTLSKQGNNMNFLKSPAFEKLFATIEPKPTITTDESVQRGDIVVKGENVKNSIFSEITPFAEHYAPQLKEQQETIEKTEKEQEQKIRGEIQETTERTETLSEQSPSFRPASLQNPKDLTTETLINALKKEFNGKNIEFMETTKDFEVLTQALEGKDITKALSRLTVGDNDYFSGRFAKRLNILKERGYNELVNLLIENYFQRGEKVSKIDERQFSRKELQEAMITVQLDQANTTETANVLIKGLQDLSENKEDYKILENALNGETVDKELYTEKLNNLKDQGYIKLANQIKREVKRKST